MTGQLNKLENKDWTVWVRIPARARFFYLQPSRPALRPTPLHWQWMPGFFTGGEVIRAWSGTLEAVNLLHINTVTTWAEPALYTNKQRQHNKRSAIAQAISYHIFIAEAQIQSQAVHVQFVVKQVATTQVFLQIFRVSPPAVISQIFSTHSSPGLNNPNWWRR
jgi:hypothetical protein